MSESPAFEDLVESFLERRRLGSAPEISLFAAEHPGHAKQLTELLPLMLELEGLGAARPPKPPASPPPLPDLTGSDYRLIRQIGSGGMGLVFEALQLSLNRKVAVKLLLPSLLPDAARREQFQNEAHVIAMLHHPNIVRILSAGCSAECCFYAMELIDGRGLDQYQFHDLREIAGIGLQAARALAYAHRCKVMHRDIKPANLLLDSAGVVHVGDFGLLLLAVSLAAAQEPRPERILVVSSFHLSHVWTKKLCAELDRKFIETRDARVIDYLELNAVRNRQGNFTEKFEAYLPHIRKGDYAMVIGLLDDANELIVKHASTFPKELPIILCGYRDLAPGFKERHPNMTGFTGAYDLRRTIDFGLKIYPDTEEIALICDDFTSGRQLYEQAQKIMLDFKRCRFTLLYGGMYSTQQVLQHVAVMPRKSLIIFAPWRNFTKDHYVSLEQVAEELSQTGKRPFLVFTDVLLGHGALGGFLTDGGEMGKAAARLAERIFNGEDVRKIDFQPMPVACVLDMTLYDRERLDRALLPAGATRLNDRPSVFREYPFATLLVVSLFGLLLAAFGGMIVMHAAYRRRSRTQLNDLAESYTEIERLAEEQRITLEAIDDGLIVVDSNTFVVMANDAAATLTGWSREEMPGKPLARLYELVSSFDNVKKASPVLQVLKDGKPIKILQNLILVSRSGKRCPIAENISALRNRAGEIFGAVVLIRDMTREHRWHTSITAAMHSLETAADLAHITYSQIVLESNMPVEFGKEHERNWGMENGRPLPPSRWLHPDDLSRFEQAWNELYRKKSDGFKLNYRSEYHEETRYFTMEIKSIAQLSGSAAPICNCIIQDVSESERYRQRLDDTNRYLNTLIDLLPALLIVKDPQNHLKFVTANRKFAEMIGRSQEEIVGKTDYDLFEPESAQKYQEDDLKVAVAGGCSSFTETLPGPDRLNIIQTMKTVITAPDGRKLVLALATDITELERTKQEALRSAELLQAIIDNAPVGLLLKDPDDDYRYLLWNAELGRNTNTPVSAVEGKTDWEWDVYRDRAEYFRCQDEQVMRTNRAIILEEELPISSGGSIFYRTAKMPITLSNGKRYLLGTFVNITGLKQLTRQLEDTVAAQKTLLESEHIYNECLKIISLSEHYGDAVNDCLAAIGEHCGADHCFICSHRTVNGIFDRNFEWSKPGEPAYGDRLSSLPLADNTTIWNELNTGGCCLINDFSQRPELLHEFKAVLGEHFDMTSAVLYGIFDESGFYGIFGLSSSRPEQKFSDAAEKILSNCAKLYLLHRERGLRKFELDRAVMIREMIFTNIDIPILLFDKDGKLININETGCRNLCVTQREALEIPCNQLFCRCNIPPPECPVRKVIRSGSGATYALSCNNRDYHIDAKPIFDERGELIYVLGCALDMTDFNTSQRKLVAAMESAQAGERAKTNFISTMNHELRTPLNAVIGFSELLEDGGYTPAEQRDFIKAIGNSGRTLLNMINDILDISKLDAGHFELHLSKVDFKEVLRDLEALFRQSVKEKNLEFRLVLPAFLPEIYTDVPRLRQIIINLVGNAIKFTRIGEVSLTVLFEPLHDDIGKLRIEVADTGIGISPATMPKIFQPFVQDEKVRSSRAYQGSGLGLAITRKMIDVMQGRIDVSSCENIGSTFTVEWDNVKFDFSDKAQIPAAHTESGEGSLLVVDDLPMNLRILEALLKKLGRNCVSAESGQQALKLMAEKKFDIVLTDIWMPDMDGVELAKKIRREANGDRENVFAITADGDWDGSDHAGLFDGVFHKPIKLEDIRTILQTAVRRDEATCSPR